MTYEDELDVDELPPDDEELDFAVDVDSLEDEDEERDDDGNTNDDEEDDEGGGVSTDTDSDDDVELDDGELDDDVGKWDDDDDGGGHNGLFGTQMTAGPCGFRLLPDKLKACRVMGLGSGTGLNGGRAANALSPWMKTFLWYTWYQLIDR